MRPHVGPSRWQPTSQIMKYGVNAPIRPRPVPTRPRHSPLGPGSDSSVYLRIHRPSCVFK